MPKTVADMTGPASATRQFGVLCIAAGLLYLAGAVTYTLVGEVNADEGFYLYTGRIVYEGRVPYRDFFFTQSPLAPYIYGVAQHIVGTGLYAGRATAVAFGLAAFILALCTARHLAGLHAAIIAAALVLCTLPVVYWLSVPKTYPLAGCFLAAGCCAYTSRVRDPWRYALAALFFALATGVRLSALPALVVLAAAALWFSGWRALATVVVTGTVVLAAIFLPFALPAGDQFLFNVLGSHLGSYGHRQVIHVILARKAFMVRKYLENYPALVALAAAVSVVFAWRYRLGAFRELLRQPGFGFLAPTLAALVLAQLLPWQSLHEYQVMNAPVAAAFLGAAVAAWIGKITEPLARCGQVIGIIALTAVLGASRFGYMVDVRDGRLPVEEVKHAADILRRELPPDAVVFTSIPAIALEAGLHVPDEQAMGWFTYYLGLDSERARRLKVLNPELVRELLATRNFAALVLAGNEFDDTMLPEHRGDRAALRAEISACVGARYDLVETVSAFGRQRTDLDVYLSRGRRGR